MTAKSFENTTTSPAVEPSIEHGLEQTVLPGVGLTLIAPTRRDLYQNRLAAAEGDVAELFQINSRWKRGDLAKLPDVEEQKALRAWFLSSGRMFTLAEGQTGPTVPFSTMADPLGVALAKIVDAGTSSGLLFSADIAVILDGWSHLAPAGATSMVRMRRFEVNRRNDMVTSISPDMRLAFETAIAVVAVIVSPKRIQVTHGSRGLRNALLETGMLIGNLGSMLAGCGLRPAIAVDFEDTTIDRVLDLDGVERFTVALIALHEAVPDGERA
jgi:hypothetical protein